MSCTFSKVKLLELRSTKKMEKENSYGEEKRAMVIYKISSLNSFVIVIASSTTGLVAWHSCQRLLGPTIDGKGLYYLKDVALPTAPCTNSLLTGHNSGKSLHWPIFHRCVCHQTSWLCLRAPDQWERPKTPKAILTLWINHNV